MSRYTYDNGIIWYEQMRNAIISVYMNILPVIGPCDKEAHKTNLSASSAHVLIIARAEYTINLPQLKKTTNKKRKSRYRTKINYFGLLLGLHICILDANIF